MERRRPTRAGLIGMGVAGGLVPSPSALVVLLGAAALGRTWFGVVLVVTYGLGMAATLTAAGLLLVRVASRWAGRLPRALATGRLAAATPLMTAGVVLVVGLGLAARSLATV
jgi:ABC-type nickel/cobalt efflux system permease component RcnA